MDDTRVELVSVWHAGHLYLLPGVVPARIKRGKRKVASGSSEFISHLNGVPALFLSQQTALVAMVPLPWERVRNNIMTFAATLGRVKCSRGNNLILSYLLSYLKSSSGITASVQVVPPIKMPGTPLYYFLYCFRYR